MLYQKFRMAGRVAAILFMLFLPQVQAAEKGNVAIAIYSVNDFHGALQAAVNAPGIAKLSAYLNEQRKIYQGATVLLSAGDMFQGSLLSNLAQGSSVVEAMNSLGFDAMTLGNHEFDWGAEVLRTRIGESSFPYLCANLKDEQKLVRDNIRPSVLLECQGVKIGIIGIMTPETAEKVHYRHIAPFSFADPATAAQNEIDKLRLKGAKIIIINAHMGALMKEGAPVGEVVDFAKKLRGVDLIVSGHTHQQMTSFVGGVPVVQAGYNGQAVTKTVFLYDKGENRILRVMPSVMRLQGKSLPTDAAMEKFVAKAERLTAPLANERLGNTATALPHQRYGESLLGQYLTDLMRKEASADIAFFNSGGIRAGLPYGVITTKDLYTALPFDNTLVTMDLTGAQIIELLRVSLRGPDFSVMQFSGIDVRAERRAGETQLLSVSFADGKLLERARVYRVAMNDFLAAGGDGLSFLRGLPQSDTGIFIRECMATHIRAAGTIKAIPETRLRIEHAKQEEKKAA